MATKNCPICGKIFNDAGGFEIVCLLCKPAFDAEFDRVRDILYEHPEYNIMQVSELTGLTINRLRLYLREGRIIAVNNTNAALLSCIECGRAIEAGDYCPICEYKHRMKTPIGHYVGGKASSRMYSRSDGEEGDENPEKPIEKNGGKSSEKNGKNEKKKK